MNRESLKYLAAAAMTCNHIALIFLTPGTLLHDLLEDIGYFTAITMCYFLVEGYHYTRSRKAYFLRLAVFAVLSQLPFSLAFDLPVMNFLVTLCICFAILWVMDKGKDRVFKLPLLGLLLILSMYCDWQCFAPGMTILFEKSRGDRQKLKRSYGIMIAVFSLVNMLALLTDEYYTPATALLQGLGSGMGMALSAAAILYLYNGRTARTGKRFHQWFFYVYYPLHLLVLWRIRVFLID